MNYCTLQDAWGNNNYISEQYKRYDNNVETFTANLEEPYIMPPPPKPIPKLKKKKITCDEIIYHLNHCAACRQKVYSNNNTLVKKINNIIIKNKDTVLLGLIILFVCVFLNLLMSIFRR